MSADGSIAAWPLPWLAGPWERLWAAAREGRLGHALLIAGPPGIGKRLLAERLTAALLCGKSGADGTPCGQCDDCRLLAAGNHPDRVMLTPDPAGKSREIKVDEVREVCARQALTSHGGRCKVIAVVPAEALNTVAANSLLKTLEEPAPSTRWTLVSEDPGRLPQTIRSRCQRLNLPIPPEPLSLPWLREQLRGNAAEPGLLLRLAHGAPLAALALAGGDGLAQRESGFAGFVAVGRGERDPLALADAWQRQDPSVVLGHLASWVCDLLRLCADPAAVWLDNPDKRPQLLAMAAGIAPAAGHRYLRRVLVARGVADASVNKLLTYEALLVRWARLASGVDRDGR